MDWLDTLSWICIGLGVFFAFTSAVGMHRFEELFTRLHAASITDAAALPLVFIGIALQYEFGLATLKIAFLIGLAMITAATATHALARAATISGHKPYTDDQVVAKPKPNTRTKRTPTAKKKS